MKSLPPPPPLTLSVCGRNQKLRHKLERFKWPKVCELGQHGESGQERPTQVHEQESTSSEELGEQEGGEKRESKQEGDGEQEGGRERVKIRVVGFLDNVEEYMLASDVIVSKAGPGIFSSSSSSPPHRFAGSIAEAAACGRPCMIYDFLPGQVSSSICFSCSTHGQQEEANVDFVLKRRMGGFEPDANKAAQVVLSWLNDQPTLRKLVIISFL